MTDAIISHAACSAVTDLGVSGEVGPTDWNAALVLSAGSSDDILIRDPSSATGGSWTAHRLSVRRREVGVVQLSTGEAPDAAFWGNAPTLAFSTCSAASVKWTVEVPSDMNVEKASYLFAVLGGCSASTQNVRSVLEYLSACHAGGNPEAAAASTANLLTASTTTGRLSEQLVGTFTSGLFAQNSVLSFSWKRDSCSTAAGDAHPGRIHLVSFQLQYSDRRQSTST